MFVRDGGLHSCDHPDEVSTFEESGRVGCNSQSQRNPDLGYRSHLETLSFTRPCVGSLRSRRFSAEAVVGSGGILPKQHITS